MSLVLAALLLPVLAFAFEQIDIDLFKLHDAVQKDLGKDFDFYKWLGVKPSANHKDIVSAYRKVSRKIHPDRNPGPGADERFARFNQVYKVLRSEARDRYNYYLSKGFPNLNESTETWSYKRFRPNLAFVLVLLAVLGSVVELFSRKTSARRQRDYFAALIADARAKAAEQSKTGVVTSSTAVELRPGVTVNVHANGDVYFSGTKVDPAVVGEPTWRDLFLCSWLLRLLGKQAPEAGDVLGSTEASAPNADADISKEEAVTVESEDAEEPELKKGASRRRKAAARGKARVFT